MGGGLGGGDEFLNRMGFGGVEWGERPGPGGNNTLMKNNKILVAVLLAVGFSGAAFAEKAEGDKPKRAGGPEALVKRLDKDKNGELSADELSKMKEEARTKLMAKADKNSDGALDKDELEKMKAHGAKPGGKKPGEKKPGGKKKDGDGGGEERGGVGVLLNLN